MAQDFSLNPSEAKLNNKNVTMKVRKIKKPPNLSMDNVTLYSMLSKQTRDL